MLPLTPGSREACFVAFAVAAYGVLAFMAAKAGQDAPAAAMNASTP